MFNASGQQKALLPGQQLNWTPRGELHAVTQVMREGAEDDGESYRYDIGNQRVLKVSTQKTATHMRTQRVQYLPGLELRSTTHGGMLTEQLQVVLVGEAGHAQVRALHWAAGKPPEFADAQLRYSYADQLGSGCLEVDGSGAVISREEYYPYGGTAVWAARSEVQGRYKFVRYSGKERDATGLYYYGYRYYQPWLGRWLSADPAGTVDGLNLYAMVRNNPMTLVDELGLMGKKNEEKSSGLHNALASRRGGPVNAPVAPISSSTRTSREGAGAAVSSSNPAPSAAGGPLGGGVPNSHSRSPEEEVERKFGLHGTPTFKSLAAIAFPGTTPGSNVLAIGQRPNPFSGEREIILLENISKLSADKKRVVSGFRHITDEHRGHFEKDGIKGDQKLQEAVMKAVIHYTPMAIQNAATERLPRPIYKIGLNDRTHYIAVQIETTEQKNVHRIKGANPNRINKISQEEKVRWTEFYNKNMAARQRR